jgi:hypothetical protein
LREIGGDDVVLFYKEADFVRIKKSLRNISGKIYDDNLDTAKKIIIRELHSVDCKELNEHIQDIQQAQDSEKLKEQVGSIVFLCDLIVKTQYNLC